MKKIFFLLAISFGMLVSAQKNNGKHHEDKKSYIHDFEKMTHEEKMAFIQQLSVNKIIKELELSGEKKDTVEKGVPIIFWNKIFCYPKPFEQLQNQGLSFLKPLHQSGFYEYPLA